MERTIFFSLSLLAAAGLFCAAGAKDNAGYNKSGESPKEIVLQKIDFSKGKTVLQAVKDRRSEREFADKKLDMRLLSELLWVAGGINREETGGRTAPTAMNSRETDVYAFMREGAYLYIPGEHKLVLVSEGDVRSAAGLQDYVAQAAVNLVYVSDISRMKGGSDYSQKLLMAAVDVGHVSENVYLCCSSADLACVTRAYLDEAAIAKLLKLKDSQKVILSQSAGYRK